jgi:hypothetical protein
MKSHLQDDWLGQLRLGTVVFVVTFGMPLGFWLAANHLWITVVYFPFILLPPLGMMWLQSRRSGQRWPWEITTYLILLSLQMCCVGWLFLIWFADPQAVDSVGWGLFALFFGLGIARRVIWILYKRRR